ncbi:hypothetical protein FVEG_14873 [Fusarium verticillioides 7600]|uniref:3'-5' exonuclease domain-containing protein n=1 Tax=Gibberella moniliformis (strain M3125 / FGSC 7600) TaxID=334819 RepID=W7LS52_GIBM7|nr:hypothetical protein FVEG_14873 [Fusarium verticillioides 7600]EWG38345.1 hypothetical protein FVEG_14873 [Fusarium verticillioides 7600]
MEDLTLDVEVINTIQGAKSLADGIAVLNASHRNELPLLYIDIDPQGLGPKGELNLLTIMLCYGPEYHRRLYLVDVHRLANQAFSSRGYYGASLRSILDSGSYQKVFFDVGYHSHILYNQYGIMLQGVSDLQLMENACRRNRRNLQSFEPLVDSLLVHGRNRRRWLVDKFNGQWSYKNCAGAPHGVFQQRPVATYIRLYCCRNIRFMPELYDKIRRAIPKIMELVAEVSQRRIEESQDDGYDPSESGRLRSPWTVEQIELLDHWLNFGPVFIYLTLGSCVS